MAVGGPPNVSLRNVQGEYGGGYSMNWYLGRTYYKSSVIAGNWPGNNLSLNSMAGSSPDDDWWWERNCACDCNCNCK